MRLNLHRNLKFFGLALCVSLLPLVSWTFLQNIIFEGGGGFSLEMVTIGHYYFWFVIAASMAFVTFRKLSDKIVKDNLTILYNQPAFFDLAQRHFQIGVRYDDHLAIIMMDLDHFKKVNDSNNHLVGSALLKQVAEIIASNLRDTDIAARFGGDEFIVCLPRTSLPAARIVAERIKSTIASHEFHYQERRLHVTASLGVAVMRCRYQYSVERLVERADKHLYAAKAAGRNALVTDQDGEVDL